MKFLLAYLFIVNAAAFISMLADKFFARNNLWRIPEATLLLLAVIGGSLGSLIGMYAVRHKTSHLRFTLGIPVILGLQIAAVIWYLT
jgi:uncharacterized membrane protein YsdA (DUF1294 family)